jgi:hypothetical protein
MHKGIILLVKTDDFEGVDREWLLNAVQEFMSGYQDTVYDYWSVGGRWTQHLCSKRKEFMCWANDLFKNKKDGFVSYNEIEENKEALQEKWNSLGLSGQNPHCNHYNIGFEGQDYDILPLSECLEIVKDWNIDHIAEGKNKVKHADDWLTKRAGEADVYDMYGYYLKSASQFFRQEFSSNCNIYNITCENYSIPEDITGWWAVMVDIHS